MAETFDDVQSSTLQASPVENHRSSSGSNTDANVTLWQFLLDLLLKQQYSNIICWTNNEGEFKLLDAEQVAKLWGHKKNKNNMTYDKLSRALRYYYDKNIIKKVMGQKFVYKFVSFPEMVKTENRIPFKKKMESIVNESMSNTIALKAEPSIATASSFQTLRPYDVKAGLIQQAQQLAAAQFQALQQAQQADYMAKYQSLSDEQNRLAANQDRLSVSPHIHIKTEALSPGSNYSPHGEHGTVTRSGIPAAPVPVSMSGDEMDEDSSDLPFSKSSHQHSTASLISSRNSIPVPNHNGGLLQLANQTNGLRTNGSHISLHQGAPTDLSMKRQTATASPLNVCTPNPSPPAAHSFELPRSATPTPPPVSTSSRDSEVTIKLEIPELDGSNRKSSPSEKRTLKHQKSKPEPISISNDVPPPGPMVYSPHRNLLPSLNTPMFMNSPLFNSRTPLLNGLQFWSGAGISPGHTLSPHLQGGLQAPSAFQFPSFAVSPATLASFSQWSDSVFANTATPITSEEKKFFPTSSSK